MHYRLTIADFFRSYKKQKETDDANVAMEGEQVVVAAAASASAEEPAKKRMKRKEVEEM